MITHLPRAAATLFAVVVLLAAFGASPAPAAEFDYDPDIHSVLSIDVSGSGLVTGTPGEEAAPGCHPSGSGRCHVTYLKNSVVNLHADPDPGWFFTGWSGCLHTFGLYCQVYMAEKPDTTYDSYWAYATFARIDPSTSQHQLTVSVDGPGRVTGAGIDCPGDCSQSFISGAWVTLHTQAGPLASFAGWSGACSGGPMAACVVKADAAKHVTATFVTDVPIGTPRTLTVHKVGAGQGSVSSGSAINCPGDCSQEYTLAIDVTLTATPAAGSSFAGWSGACSGTAATCTVNTAVSRTVVATFALAPPTPGKPGPGGPIDPGLPAPGQPRPGQPSPGQPGASPAAKPCTITGTGGRDVLVGTRRKDVICGLGGNDRLVGLAGDDILLGGAGKDVLVGGPGRDTLWGGLGDDHLTGGAGRDRLAGGKGRDVLLARDGLRDGVDGGAGRDRARVDGAKDVRKGIESAF